MTTSTADESAMPADPSLTRLLEAFFEHGLDGMLLMRPDGAVLRANPAACALLGRTEPELQALGRPGFVVPGAGADALLAPRDLDRQARGELTFRQADGATFQVEVTSSSILDESGERCGVVAFRNLTERELMARELRLRLAERDERERWLQASQRVARLGHYVFEIAEDRWTSSEVLDEILGIGPAYPRTAAGWIALVHADGREEMGAYLRELLASGTRFDREYPVGREGEAPRWVHGLGDLERGEDGRPIRLVGTIQDATARHEADRAREALAAQLQQAQKLESIGRLAGGVAHDFNNILVVILTCADGLSQRLASGQPPEAEDVEEIQAAAQRAKELTGQLLAFARKQVVAPVALDLNEAVGCAERLLNRLIGEDVELSLRLQPDVWAVTCDPGQLQQVLMNLAVNSRDAMPRGGTLTISTANVEQVGATEDGWYGTAAPPGRYVRLLVEDTGAGIPTELRARIFEPFVTTKPPGKGTGLGLATVYGIVQQAGGAVRFRSEVGHGTSFELLWPCSAKGVETSSAPDRPARRAQPAPHPSERILLVEDDDLVRDATTRALRRAGYEVTAADGGAAALALLANGRPSPQLLLTDVVMRGMNGRQVAEAVRRACPAIRILFMSGYAQDIIVHHGVVESGLDLLVKPFSNAVLLERVRAALDA
ncbi:MAG TPA: ATP-binding protein [Anaeromyxobacteraceae bacterium]